MNLQNKTRSFSNSNLKLITSDSTNSDIQHNFELLKQKLEDTKKEIQFLDFVKLIDYVTIQNADSIHSIFYQLAPGECVGIDVDQISFENGVVLNRGDFLFKKQNGEPLRIAGPSSLVYIPKLTRVGNKTVLDFYSDSDPNINFDYEKIVTDSNNNSTIVPKEGESVQVSWNSNTGKWNKDEIPLNPMQQYSYEFNYNTPSRYNQSAIISGGGTISVNKIDNAQPIIKAFYNDEEIYNAFSVTSDTTTYTVTNITGFDLRFEVK